MPQQVTTSRLANTISRAMRRAFDQYQANFREITSRARNRFEHRDWHGMQADSAERLEVYANAVDQIVARIHELLEDRTHSRPVWMAIKAVYSGLIDERDDWEIAETFFNSVTRRIFTTVGVDNEIEFVDTDYESPPNPAKHLAYYTYERGDSIDSLVSQVLGDLEMTLPGDSIAREVPRAVAAIQHRLQGFGPGAMAEKLEMIRSVFYRGEYAYLIGRIHSSGQVLPLAICLRNTEERGIVVDAVLTKENDISLLFSFTRSYFHVQVDRPYELVRFIKTIIPRKRSAEIYISIGYNRHGKTELFRNAMRHLRKTDDKYILARGQRGMVMVVFTMPSYPVVFKIIKDRFDAPKTCTRQTVIDQYHLVFRHDRAGRLMDAQEYHYMELARHLFSDELLEKLLEVSGNTVFVREDRVVIKHCYAERRVTPLNLYLQEAEPQAAREAVIDYGQTIKDLARTNIFPGDLLLKNFGVTRHGRVVFYDYDEISLLTECTIRELPDDDGLSGSEPWYGVAEKDMFPEEFGYFLGLGPEHKALFVEHHGDLLGVEFWRSLQAELRSGRLYHITPYGDDKRIDHQPTTYFDAAPRSNGGPATRRV